MTSKPSEHDDEVKNAELEQVSVDALFEHVFSWVLIPWEDAVRLSTAPPQAVEFAYFLNPPTPERSKQLYTTHADANAQTGEKAQETFFTDLQRRVGERQDVQQALDQVEQLVAEMRHDQGEIDVLKADTRRILTKLGAK